MSKKHFDLIIANPPYGSGSNTCKKITDYIIHNMDYDKYINCQPQNGYLYNDDYKYVDTDNFYHPKSFTGAQVSTSVAEILKQPREFVNEDMFRIMCFDKKFQKYFFKNVLMSNTFVLGKGLKTKTHPDASYVPENTFLFFARSTGDGVHIKGADVEWNVNGVHDLSILPLDRSTDRYCYLPITFDTKEEFNNFTNWWYSKPKTGLATKILKATGLQAGGNLNIYIPKVDWSHPWTDEEILKDYGYTEKEIEEILK